MYICRDKKHPKVNEGLMKWLLMMCLRAAQYETIMQYFICDGNVFLKGMFYAKSAILSAFG